VVDTTLHTGIGNNVYVMMRRIRIRCATSRAAKQTIGVDMMPCGTRRPLCTTRQGAHIFNLQVPLYQRQRRWPASWQTHLELRVRRPADGEVPFEDVVLQVKRRMTESLRMESDEGADRGRGPLPTSSASAVSSLPLS